MIDWSTDIILIHPIEFENEAIKKQVIDQIKTHLGKELYDAGGQRLLINDNVRRNSKLRQKINLVNGINHSIYKHFFNQSRNWTEKLPNYKMRSDLEKSACRINVVKRLFRTYLFFYKERRDVTRTIEIVRLENNCRELKEMNEYSYSQAPS